MTDTVTFDKNKQSISVAGLEVTIPVALMISILLAIIGSTATVTGLFFQVENRYEQTNREVQDLKDKVTNLSSIGTTINTLTLEIQGLKVQNVQLQKDFIAGTTEKMAYRDLQVLLLQLQIRNPSLDVPLDGYRIDE